MTFLVNSLTRCAGQGHWRVNITVTNGPTLTIATTPEEMVFDPLANLADTRELVLARVRSAAKEAGASTFAASKTAVEGKSFQL